MNLVEITADKFDLTIDLIYFTAHNFTNKPVYKSDKCLIHKDAITPLKNAIKLAGSLGYKLKIFDAFRPSDAQWVLWRHTPDPDFLADPRIGSPHSRGVAVDLTLINIKGEELDMGTGFDEFTEKSHHGYTNISRSSQINRYILLGIMTASGWDYYKNEWWHYQLFDSKRYPLLDSQSSNIGIIDQKV